MTKMSLSTGATRMFRASWRATWRTGPAALVLGAALALAGIAGARAAQNDTALPESVSVNKIGLELLNPATSATQSYHRHGLRQVHR